VLKLAESETESRRQNVIELLSARGVSAKMAANGMRTLFC